MGTPSPTQAEASSFGPMSKNLLTGPAAPGEARPSRSGKSGACAGRRPPTQMTMTRPGARPRRLPANLACTAGDSLATPLSPPLAASGAEERVNCLASKQNRARQSLRPWAVRPSAPPEGPCRQLGRVARSTTRMRRRRATHSQAKPPESHPGHRRDLKKRTQGLPPNRAGCPGSVRTPPAPDTTTHPSSRPYSSCSDQSPHWGG